jgi:hypothetical protein
MTNDATNSIFFATTAIHEISAERAVAGSHAHFAVFAGPARSPASRSFFVFATRPATYADNQYYKFADSKPSGERHYQTCKLIALCVVVPHWVL